jgi:hypothetical protein
MASASAVPPGTVPRTIFPPDGYAVTPALLPDIRFTWKSAPLGASSGGPSGGSSGEQRFQLAEDSGFTRLLVDEEVRGEVFRGRPLPEGLYYWRITGAEPKRLTVAPPLPGPILREPGPGETLALRAGEEVLFRWEAPPGAEYYNFALYRDTDRTGAVYEDAGSPDLDRRILLDSGSYHWTLRGFAEESPAAARRTGLSSEGAFTLRIFRPVQLDYPAAYTEVDGLRAYLEPLEVRWSSGEDAETRSFILSRNRDLSGPPVLEEPSPSRVLPLPPLTEGLYYWTVRAAAAGGFDIGPREIRTIRVLPIPPFPAAANRAPPEGSVIGPAELRRRRAVTFSWDAVPDAEGYMLTLFREAGGKTQEILRAGPLAGTSYTLEDLVLLDQGSFIWRLEAVADYSSGKAGTIRRGGEAGANSFAIDFGLPSVPRARKPGILYGR